MQGSIKKVQKSCHTFQEGGGVYNNEPGNIMCITVNNCNKVRHQKQGRESETLSCN